MAVATLLLVALDPQTDILVVVAHPDDEALWLGGVLGYANCVVAALAADAHDSAVTRAREVVRSAYPTAQFDFLPLRSAGVWDQTDPLRTAPTDEGLRLRDSCPPETIERYRSNFSALCAAVAPYLESRPIVYTHNPWGEYGHAEHVQVSHAVTSLARERGLSVWAWDGFSVRQQLRRSTRLRADYYPDRVLARAPRAELEVDLRLFEKIRALYQCHDVWTWDDEYLPPNPSRYLQLVRDGVVLVAPRRPPKITPIRVVGRSAIWRTRFLAWRLLRSRRRRESRRREV